MNSSQEDGLGETETTQLVVGLTALALLLAALAFLWCWYYGLLLKRRKHKKEENSDDTNLKASQTDLPWEIPGLRLPWNNNIKLLDVKPYMPPPFSPSSSIGHTEPFRWNISESSKSDNQEIVRGNDVGEHPDHFRSSSPVSLGYAESDRASMTSRTTTPSKQTRKTSLSDMVMDCDWL
jgi:hypothetical protein